MDSKQNGSVVEIPDIMEVDSDASSSLNREGHKRLHVDEDGSDSAVDSLRNDILKRRRQSSGVVNQELRCPICLAEKEDTTMLSECQHTFCNACILEWLKMKPECPLCKRVPKFFKHNFQRGEAATDKPTWETSGQLQSVSKMRAVAEMDAILLASSYAADVERHAVMQVVQRLEEEVRMLQHMSSRSYTRASVYQSAIKAAQEDLTAYQSLVNMFGTASRREIFREPAFRRVIYLRNLSPRSIVAPHFAVVFNAEYARANEQSVRAQLMPYVVREYTAITSQTSVDVDEMMNAIFNYLAMKVNRLYVVTFLQQRGIRHPHHFLNNLSHFAGTGQALEVYDQNCEYTPRSTHVMPYMSGNDDILVLNSAVNNDVQVVGESTAPSRSTHSRNTESGQQMIDRFSRRLAQLRNQIRTRSQTQQRSLIDPYDFSSSLEFLMGRRNRTNAQNSAGSRSGNAAIGGSNDVVNIDDSSNSSSSDSDDTDPEENGARRRHYGGGGGSNQSVANSSAVVLSDEREGSGDEIVRLDAENNNDDDDEVAAID